MRELDRVAAEEVVGRMLTEDEYTEYMRIYNTVAIYVDESPEAGVKAGYEPGQFANYVNRLRTPVVH